MQKLSPVGREQIRQAKNASAQWILRCTLQAGCSIGNVAARSLGGGVVNTRKYRELAEQWIATEHVSRHSIATQALHNFALWLDSNPASASSPADAGKTVVQSPEAHAQAVATPAADNGGRVLMQHRCIIPLYAVVRGS